MSAPDVHAVRLSAQGLTRLVLSGVTVTALIGGLMSACSTGSSAETSSADRRAAPIEAAPAPPEDAGAGAVPAATPEPTPISVPTPGPTSSPEPPAEPTTLRRGDEGDAVRELQERLIELDYFLPSADGTFGAATEQAVWALQKAAGTTRDGLVGPATQEALDAGLRPTPRTVSGRVLEVDLERQLVLAVEDGILTRTFNVSSGNGETYRALGRTQRADTPTGDFAVVRQVDAVHESTLGLGSMYRPKYFHGGWAVHGSDEIPPWPASHGCVRMANEAINWIWDVWDAPIGTRVLVF
ncbi:L,D-transpeptidase family protein [Actinotalea sp. BY-33]|uniref:L,D-transpeptidase family protein n=1 Tax=Actinotalea soli TaxID=2819234 RepID=A0A939RS87_9CELL|nr:L,D-transpeptidase family protein [Actinotalea soli]MBO1750502.1 L,D-transpeptidase family protein [Actinotalea soli]